MSIPPFASAGLATTFAAVPIMYAVYPPGAMRADAEAARTTNSSANLQNAGCLSPMPTEIEQYHAFPKESTPLLLRAIQSDAV